MKQIPIILSVLGIFAAPAVLADHNSPHGAGWARMPNDIHNTRIDTQGDNTAFRDFVRYGNGASSTNRFLSDSDIKRGGRGRGGNDLSATDRYFRDSGRTSGRSSNNGHFDAGRADRGGRTGRMGRHGGTADNRFASHNASGHGDRGGMRGHGRGR